MVTRRAFLLIVNGLAACGLTRTARPANPLHVLIDAAEEVAPHASEWGIGSYFAGLANRAPLMRFAALLETTSREQFGQRFSALEPRQRTQVMMKVERAHAEAFVGFRDLVYEGCYGDPRHGGNRNRAAWAGIQFP